MPSCTGGGCHRLTFSMDWAQGELKHTPHYTTTLLAGMLAEGPYVFLSLGEDVSYVRMQPINHVSIVLHLPDTQRAQTPVGPIGTAISQL